MIKYSIYSLKFSFVLSFCFMIACAEDMRGTVSSGGGTRNVFGDCAATGNLTEFTVTCTKDIQSFKQKGWHYAGSIHDYGHDIQIHKDTSKTLKGNAKDSPEGLRSFKIEVYHADGTTSIINIAR